MYEDFTNPIKLSNTRNPTGKVSSDISSLSGNNRHLFSQLRPCQKSVREIYVVCSFFALIFGLYV